MPFYDRTAEEWTGNRGERGGMTCSKGPQEESNLGPILFNSKDSFQDNMSAIQKYLFHVPYCDTMFFESWKL